MQSALPSPGLRLRPRATPGHPPVDRTGPTRLPVVNLPGSPLPRLRRENAKPAVEVTIRVAPPQQPRPADISGDRWVTMRWCLWCGVPGSLDGVLAGAVFGNYFSIQCEDEIILIVSLPRWCFPISFGKSLNLDWCPW